jgi:hypothetical protein
MQVSTSMIPELFIAVFVGSAVIVLALALAFRFKQRELQHRERMAALEKGVPLTLEVPGSATAPWTPRVYLHRGLTWLFTGIGLAIFLFSLSLSGMNENATAMRVREATNAKNSGATEEQIREIMNDRSPRRGMPSSVALIGLIPVGVGLAYLLTYRSERRSSNA